MFSTSVYTDLSISFKILPKVILVCTDKLYNNWEAVEN